MSPFLHRCRWVSLAIAYALIYTQIFGSFQGNNPLDIGSVVKNFKLSELLIPSAHAQGTPGFLSRVIQEMQKSIDAQEVIQREAASGTSSSEDAIANKLVPMLRPLFPMYSPAQMRQVLTSPQGKAMIREKLAAAKAAKAQGVAAPAPADQPPSPAGDEAAVNVGTGDASPPAPTAGEGGRGSAIPLALLGRLPQLLSSLAAQAAIQKEAASGTSSSEDAIANKLVPMLSPLFPMYSPAQVRQVLTSPQGKAMIREKLAAAKAARASGADVTQDAPAPAADGGTGDASPPLIADGGATTAGPSLPAQGVVLPTQDNGSLAQSATTLAAGSVTTPPTPVAFQIEHDFVDTAPGGLGYITGAVRYRAIQYIEDGKKCTAVFIFKSAASKVSKELKGGAKKCATDAAGDYPGVSDVITSNSSNIEPNVALILAGPTGSQVPLLVKADKRKSADKPDDEVAYQGAAQFTYEGAVTSAQGSPTPEAPESLVSADIGQAGAPAVVTKPGDKQDTGIRSQAGLNVDRTSDKPGLRPVIDPSTGKPFTTGKSRFYQFDPSTGAASLKPEMDAQPQVNRKYLSAEEAGKFIKAATTAYNDAHRFLYGMSLISSVNYTKFDPDKAPLDDLLNVVVKKVDAAEDYVNSHRTVLTWDVNSENKGASPRKDEFEKLIQFFNPGTNPQQLPDTYEPVELTGEYKQIELCDTDVIAPATLIDRAGKKPRYYVVMSNLDQPAACESLKNTTAADKRGEKIYALDASYGCAQSVETGQSGSSCTSATGSVLTMNLKSVSGNKKKIHNFVCEKKGASCNTPQFQLAQFNSVGGADFLTTPQGETPKLMLAGCAESQRPYILWYAGSGKHFQPEGMPSDQIYMTETFFWLQYQYEAKSEGALGGAAKSACVYDASRNPTHFRVVGVGFETPNYVGVLDDTKRSQWHEFKNEANLRETLTKMVPFSSSGLGPFDPKGFHNSGTLLYRNGSGDGFFPVALDEGEYTQEMDLRIGGAVGAQPSSGAIPREQRQVLLNIWLQTGLRLDEVMFLYFYTHNMSMLEHVRGVLPIGRFLPRDWLAGSENGYRYPMAPPTDPAQLLRNTTLFHPPITLLKGSQYYVGSRQSPAYSGFFDLSNWIIRRGLLGPSQKDRFRNYDFAVPLVGSGFEMASLLALSEWVDLWVQEGRKGELMQAHARKVVSMIPAFRLYQTQFAVEGSPTNFNSIEVALRDRKDLSKVGTSSEDFINLGLIPEKPDKAKDAAARSVELGAGFQIEPIAVAHRGMEQIWRLHRPVGFPAGAGDDASIATLTERLALPTDDKGVGFQWSEAEANGVFGKGIVSGTSRSTDTLFHHMVNYKKLAEVYNKSQVSGDKSNTAPLAMDDVNAMGGSGSPKTFYGKLTQFEVKVYEGALTAYADGGTKPTTESDATVTALKNLGEALSDGDAIWVMYLQEGRVAEGDVKNIKDDAGKIDVQETDPAITHKIHIQKVNANNPLALNSLLSVEPNKPHGLIIPPIYSSVLNRSISNLYSSGGLGKQPEGGVDLHYHDVLWVEEPQSTSPAVGETFTGADLVAATLRFNMLIMYLMTFVCLNEASFNSMVSGFHELMGPDYEGLVGEEGKPAADKKKDKQNEVQKVVARMIKRIEDNKQVVMDQCWATPFIPLRAFKFPKTNVDQVVNTTIKEMGLDPALYTLSPGFGNGFELDKTAGGKLSGMKPPVEKCGAGGFLGYLTFTAAGNENCPGWIKGLQVLTSLIFVIGVIYVLANLGLFGKSAKRSITGKGGDHGGAPAAGGGGGQQAAPPVTKNPYEKREIKKL